MASLAASVSSAGAQDEDEEHAPGTSDPLPILSKDDGKGKKEAAATGAPSMDGENVKEERPYASNVAWLTLEDLLPRLADDEEREKAKQLQELCPDARPDQVVRFLRARDGDVKSAMEFLEEHLKWRKDTLPVDPQIVKEEIMKMKQVHVGRDKDGHPLFVLRGRLMGAHTYEDMENVKLSLAYIAEYVEHHVLGPLEMGTVLFSRLNATEKNFDQEWLKVVGGLLQATPREATQECCCASSLIYRGIWNVVKYFFDPITRGKIELWADEEGFRANVDKKRSPKNSTPEFIQRQRN